MTSTDRPRLPAHLVPIVVSEPRPPRPLTRHQAAALLGMHTRTLDRWIRRGRLPAIDLGGTLRIAGSDAERAASFASWTRFE
jgi:excisionase family DNA binding protein